MPSAAGIRAGAAYVELFLKDARLAKGLKAAQARLKAFGQGVTDVGKGLLATSGVLATPFLAGAKVFTDFEQQMANIATLLDDPTDQLAVFRREILRMSVEFGESTEALTGGLYDIISASVPAGEALNVLAVSARAAKAGLSDTRTAADAITTILNAYGLEASRAGDVSDLLFSIVKRGKTDFSRLAPNIGKVATIASSAGVSLEDLGAALATLTRNGISTEQAMTAVNAIIATFLKPTTEAAKVAEELGFQLDVNMLRAEGFAGVFKRIAGLPKDVLAKLFPNVEAIKGLLPALQNMEGFLADVEAMRSRAGATEDAYAKMTSTLAHSFAQLRQAGLAVLTVIGEAIAQPLAQATESVKGFVARITELVAANKDLIILAAKVVAAVAAAGAAFIALGLAVKTVGLAFGVLGSIVAGVTAVLGAVGSALAFLLSPIGLVVTGIVTLGGYLLWVSGVGGEAVRFLGKKFEILRDFATDSFDGIRDALAANDIRLAARILWLSLQVAWRKGIAVLNEQWLAFKAAFFAVLDTIAFGGAALIVNAWSGLESVWTDLVGGIRQIWSVFFRWLLTAWETWKYAVLSFLTEVQRLNPFADQDAITQETSQQRADFEKALSGIEIEAGVDSGRSERNRVERQREIQRERRASLAAIGEDADRTERNRRASQADSLKKSEDALNQARTEWQQAIQEARGKRRAFEAGRDQPDGVEPPKIDAPDLAAKLKEGIEAATPKLQEAAEVNFDVAGTFSAEALQGLGLGSSVQERTAKASEETARNTKRIAQEVADNGLVFE